MVTDATEILAMESVIVDVEVLEDIADAVHDLWLEGWLATHSAPSQSIQFREYEQELRARITERKRKENPA